MHLDGDSPSKRAYSGIMKATADIPDRELEDTIRFKKAKTGRESVDRRMRMAELASYAGTCSGLVTPEELQALRRRG